MEVPSHCRMKDSASPWSVCRGAYIQGTPWLSRAPTALMTRGTQDKIVDAENKEETDNPVTRLGEMVPFLLYPLMVTRQEEG